MQVESPKLKDFSFCAAANAGSRWHIRMLTAQGRKTTGGADTLSLCGEKMDWDLDTEITDEHLSKNTCPVCNGQIRFFWLGLKKPVKFVSAIVIVGRGSDVISLQTDFSSPRPKVDKQDLCLDFTAEKGTGADYVRKHFGIEPEIVNVGIEPEIVNGRGYRAKFGDN
jgi:hypothetical protein